MAIALEEIFVPAWMGDMDKIATEVRKAQIENLK